MFLLLLKYKVTIEQVGDLERKGYTSGGKFIFEPANPKTTTTYTFKAPTTIEVFNNSIPFPIPIAALF
jgi:hypothetical protein